jgi:hypothetical protein
LPTLDGTGERAGAFCNDAARYGPRKVIRWSRRRIYLGKNSLTRVAFGRSPEEEYKDNLYQVSKVSASCFGKLCPYDSLSFFLS